LPCRALAVLLLAALPGLAAPADTGLLSPPFMLGNFLACITGTSAILLAIVFYAVSETSRAEALAILDVIRSLPDAYRETLVLRLVEGFTGPEIAERTGLTPASVRVNLHRGMALLRAKLQQ